MIYKSYICIALIVAHKSQFIAWFGVVMMVLVEGCVDVLEDVEKMWGLSKLGGWQSESGRWSLINITGVNATACTILVKDCI